ncbi:fmn-binding split barrel-related [Paramyrothecium foliicola]|nr:fmn-binding split barrel-related [Paramyrothecium foliicola]
MKLLSAVAALSGVTAIELPHGLSSDSAGVSRIPTSRESAVMARRVLALSKLATLSTVFPDSSSSGAGDDDKAAAREHRPAGLEGVPIGLMDYVADCEDDGNPTILEIKIATSFKNVRAGSNITASFQWVPPYPPSRRISMLSRLVNYVPFYSPKGSAEDTQKAFNGPDTVPFSAANLPRFSLVGYLEPINPDPLGAVSLAACFTSKHQDAKYWLPGNVIHSSSWSRLVVTQVYWIGGFGDRAYIGWIPIEEWRNVTKDEWTSIKLPGEEKDWNEWSVKQMGEL